MAISGYARDEFGTKLAGVLFAARPIQSREFLLGRDDILQRIEEALYSNGRSIFIYGDRGVGKSSVAATAAFQYQSSDAEPIFVSGSSNETFASIIVNIAQQAVGRSSLTSGKTVNTAGLDLYGLKLGRSYENSQLDLASKIKTISDAANLLKEVASIHSEKPIVVIDEFDTITSQDERNKFASLLKTIGDQGIALKFIFTGIGSSVEELLGAHPSSYRQLETIELRKLDYEDRRHIAFNAADAFGVDLDSDIAWRISMICDGYPYYIHLIMEKMLWVAFNKEKEVAYLENTIFEAGLRQAINSISAELKRPYEKAVLHRNREFEDAVWATANSEDSHNDNTTTFKTYEHIITRRPGGLQLPQAAFTQLLRKLRQPAFGALLEGIDGRPGWFAYREKMLRGYVRMQAEANGIPLNGAREVPRPVMRATSNARTGYNGPSIPRGVHLDRPINEWSEDSTEN